VLSRGSRGLPLRLVLHSCACPPLYTSIPGSRLSLCLCAPRASCWRRALGSTTCVHRTSYLCPTIVYVCHNVTPFLAAGCLCACVRDKLQSTHMPYLVYTLSHVPCRYCTCVSSREPGEHSGMHHEWIAFVAGICCTGRSLPPLSSFRSWRLPSKT